VQNIEGHKKGKEGVTNICQKANILIIDDERPGINKQITEPAQNLTKVSQSSVKYGHRW